VVRTNRFDNVDDTELARRAVSGDGDAFGTLFERWFDRVFDVAWHIVRNRDTAAEVAQEAFATAWRQRSSLRQPESFGGWLLRIARNKALNRLQREGRSRPIGDEETLVVIDTRSSGGDAADGLVDRERDDLVWAASAALGEDDASLLSLHLRHELRAPELAEELGVEPNTAHQRLFRLKKRLAEALGAWVLWRRGAPACAALRTTLSEAGLSVFDRATAKAIAAHAKRCDECDETRLLQLSPEALFAAVPIVPAGSLLKANAAAALTAQDVPVSASSAEAGKAATPASRASEEPRAAAESAGPPSDAPESPPAGRKPPRLSKGLLAAAAVVVVAVTAGLFLAGRSEDGSRTETAGSSGAGGSTQAEPGTVEGDRQPQPDTTAAGPEEGTEGPTSSSVTPQPPPSGPPADAPQEPAPAVDTPPAPTTTATTRPPTTTTPVAPPVIEQFSSLPLNVPCTAPEIGVEFTWASTGGDSATLGPVGGPAEPVGTSGSVDKCTLAGSTWELVVSGPGGQVASTTMAS
jgi:RNA polymerase sigma factor (sigma-70 family)